MIASRILLILASAFTDIANALSSRGSNPVLANTNPVTSTPPADAPPTGEEQPPAPPVEKRRGRQPKTEQPPAQSHTPAAEPTPAPVEEPKAEEPPPAKEETPAPDEKPAAAEDSGLTLEQIREAFKPLVKAGRGKEVQAKIKEIGGPEAHDLASLPKDKWQAFFDEIESLKM